MKKILFLLAMLPMMFFTTCSSDNDGFVPDGVYVYEMQDYYGSDDNYTYNIRFINSNQYEFIYKAKGRIIENRTSTYTISYPNVSFKDFYPKIIMGDAEGIFVDENTIRIGSSEYIKK